MIRRRGVTVYVDDDIYEWSGHRREILDKMNELAEFLYSLETGQTEMLIERPIMDYVEHGCQQGC